MHAGKMLNVHRARINHNNGASHFKMRDIILTFSLLIQGERAIFISLQDHSSLSPFIFNVSSGNYRCKTST